MNVSMVVLLLACVAIAPIETDAEAASHQDTHMRATVIALKLDELKKAQVERVEQALGAVKGVMRASFNLDLEIMTVFVDVDGPASADKLLKYLDLAGYTGTEASEQELEQALGAMRTGDGMIVFRREEASADARTATFPDTPAGRIAEAFIAAFNSGDENEMRVFSETHRSKSALESKSMKDRLEQYRELHGDWGRLDVRSVESSDERNVTVTVKPERGFSGLAMTFQFENAPPHKLSEIRITATFLEDGNDQSSNERSAGGKMGEVTILTESLKPLRDHFNANKHKHRFVALLSPT